MLEITSLVAAYNNVYHIPLHFAYTIVMSCQLKSEIAGSPKLVDEGGGGPQLSKHMVFTDGIDIGRKRLLQTEVVGGAYNKLG
jgi:hypothetical protein